MAIPMLLANQPDFADFQRHFASWHRLEPRARTNSTNEGLRAAIADPLWMLARQWQMGEFKAEDNGSPIRAKVTWRTAPLSQAIFGGGLVDLEGGPPLEAIVERERVPLVKREREPAGETEPMLIDWRLRVRLGQRFRRAHFAKAGPLTKTLISFIAAHPPFRFPTAADADHGIDRETARFLRIVSGREIDIVGASNNFDDDIFLSNLSQALAGNAPLFKNVKESCLAAFKDVKSHLSALFTQPEAFSAWSPASLGYGFRVAAVAEDGTSATLSAQNYRNGDLDWYTFTVDAVAAPVPPRTGGATGGRPSSGVPPQTGDVAGGRPPPPMLPQGGGVAGGREGGIGILDLLARCDLQEDTFNPTRVRFRGMPHRRWWRIEDGMTDFGSLDVAPSDLVKLLLMEFALIQGDDWYLHPLPLPVGSLTKIESLRVTNVFGETRDIHLGADVASARPEQRWEMFSLSRSAAPGSAGMTGVLFVPPAISVGPPSTNLREESPPVEEVRFSPDEDANMFWAVEHTVRNGLGKPVSGREAHAERRELSAKPPATSASAPAAAPAQPALPRYRLATKTPDHWIPLLDDSQGRLTQGRAPDPDATTPDGLRGPEPLTAILGGNAPTPKLDKVDKSVLRGGLSVQLTWQRVRWIDGKTYVWLGRKVVPGAGAVRSGLEFDILIGG